MNSVDLTQVEETLRQMTHNWYAAENKHDIEAYMSYIADNCTIHPPDAPPLVGKQAIRQQLIEPFLEALVSVTYNIERVVVGSSADLAYEIGDQQAVTKGPDGEIQLETKYVLVWQKLDGRWQCVTMSVTYNEPMS